MKKALLMGSVMLLAFTLAFSACNDTYNLTETETIPSLAAPGNFKAVNDQEGVITLTWDPVYDAVGYEIYRKTGDESPVRVYGPSTPAIPFQIDGGKLGYYDIVSSTNLLVDGTEYTYTVVAVSAASTSQNSAVEVVQNATSTTTVTPAKIPATSAYAVPVVGNLAVARVTLPNGNKAVQVSWDKPANPGVVYKGELGGTSFGPPTSSTPSYELSPDGTKVIWNYSGSLTDGEKYKVEIIAAYANDYYQESAPAAVDYTHSAPANIIAVISGTSTFTVSPITVNASTSPYGVSGYNVSVYWQQDQRAPTTGVTYELYRHKGANVPSSSAFEWEQVTGITIPAPDAAGFIQLTLSGANVPAYRQEWTYKLVAKVGGEEVESATSTLNGIWSSLSIMANGNSDPVTVTGGVAGKKINVQVDRLSGLYAGDVIEFYAAPSSLINSNDNPVSSDQYLAQFTKIGELTKANLESITPTDRAFQGLVSSAGSYKVIAVLKNGNTRIPKIALRYIDGSYNIQEPNEWSVSNVIN